MLDDGSLDVSGCPDVEMFVFFDFLAVFSFLFSVKCGSQVHNLNMCKAYGSANLVFLFFQCFLTVLCAHFVTIMNVKSSGQSPCRRLTMVRHRAVDLRVESVYEIV